MFSSSTNYSPVPSFSASLSQIHSTSSFSSSSNPSDAAFTQHYLSQPSIGYLNQSHDALLAGVDINSPEAFRQSIRAVLGEVQKLQLLARTVLTSIQSAYQPGIAPHHTQANISRLQEQLAFTIEVLRHTGVGALPVLSVPSDPNAMSAVPRFPSEVSLLESISKNLQVLYDQLQRRQGNAGVVSNLLGLDKDKEQPTLNA